MTVSVDATQNDFGVTDPADIQAAIWDHARDAELGTVLFTGQLGAPVVAATAEVGAVRAVVGTPPRGSGVSVAASTPAAGAATARATVASGPPQVLAAVPGTASATPVASSGGSEPIAYLDPGTREYYVELSLCVTDASGQQVGEDELTVSLVDGAGTPLGTAHGTTGAGGCFSGDVQQAGSGANVQPAMVTVTDASGGTSNLSVSLGAPLVRPPRNPLPTP